MNKTLKTILIILATVVIVALLVSYSIFKGRVSSNPDNWVGNTASNLNNGGTFCEYDGKVYFANSADNDALYVMNSDETGVKKITDTAVLSINADSDRIYYAMSINTNGTGLGYIRKPAGLYSIKHNGNSSICYTTNPVASALLYGNTLYYQNYQKSSGTTIYSIETNRKNNHEILNQMVNFTCALNDRIYFGNMDGNHHLFEFDPMSELAIATADVDMFMPVVEPDGWVYYMDPTEKYSLRRYSLQTGESQLLSSERLESFNKYGDFIYYQTNSSSPALHRIYYDGTNDTIIADGIYCDIQTTSYYVYFRPFNQPSVTYHCNHYGTIKVEPFNP